MLFMFISRSSPAHRSVVTHCNFTISFVYLLYILLYIICTFFDIFYIINNIFLFYYKVNSHSPYRRPPFLTNTSFFFNADIHIVTDISDSPV